MYVSRNVNRDFATSLPDDPATLRAELLRVIDERDDRVATMTCERDEMTRSRDEIMKSHDEVSKSRDALEHRVSTLEHMRIVLEHQNRTLLQRLYGKKSERLSDEDLVLFHGFMQETLKQDGEPNIEAETDDPAKATKRKRTGRPSGEAAIPKHLVDTAELAPHDLPPERRACTCCGTEMRACGETTRLTLEYVPAKIVAVRHVRIAYRCQTCNTFAAGPAAPIPVQKSIATPGLLAAVIVGKYATHLPHYRLEGILARSGVDLTRQTMCGWLWPASQLLSPLVVLMKRMILSASVVLTDDTPTRLLDPGLGKTREGRFWSYLAMLPGFSGIPERLVVYEFTRNRNHEHPHAFLKEFRGTLVSDAFAGYERLGEKDDAIANAGCWAHVRRKFKDALKLDERLCGEVLARIAAMYAAERAVNDAVEAEIVTNVSLETAIVRPPEAPFAAARRAELRNERVAPLVTALIAFLESVRTKHVPKSDVTAAIEYVLRRPDWFTRFLHDGDVPIDNNACERSLRGIAVGRKNWLFPFEGGGSEGGGDAASVFFSLLCSASLAEVEPYAYLRDVLERLAKIRNARLPGCPSRAPTDQELGELLPAAWLRANPQHRLETNRSWRKSA